MVSHTFSYLQRIVPDEFIAVADGGDVLEHVGPAEARVPPRRHGLPPPPLLLLDERRLDQRPLVRGLLVLRPREVGGGQRLRVLLDRLCVTCRTFKRIATRRLTVITGFLKQSTDATSKCHPCSLNISETISRTCRQYCVSSSDDDMYSRRSSMPDLCSTHKTCEISLLNLRRWRI